MKKVIRIIPAIDILDNKVVRLKQGIMENATGYHDDPLHVAKSFVNSGIKRIHIVDLNAARGDFEKNKKTVESIIKLPDVDIEIGGGVRTLEDADRLIDIGAKYIIIGTVAVKSPDIAEDILSTYKSSIIIGIDARGEFIATDGWYQNSKTTVFQLIDRYATYRYDSIIYTDISKDGMLEGLNLSMTDRIAQYSKRNIIASGGVSSIEDIQLLKQLNNPYITGCIVGKSLYEGTITLDEIIGV